MPQAVQGSASFEPVSYTHLDVYKRQALPLWQRVAQRNWDDPDTDRLRGSLGRLLAQCKRPAILVGHSLGALAGVCLACEMRNRVAAVMLVAPAEPAKFHAQELVPAGVLPVPGILVASHTDPFLSFERAEYWAALWGSELVDLGEAGHINADAGFGQWCYGLEPVSYTHLDVYKRQPPATRVNC